MKLLTSSYPFFSGSHSAFLLHVPLKACVRPRARGEVEVGVLVQPIYDNDGWDERARCMMCRMRKGKISNG